MSTSLIVRMDKEKKERFDRMARRRGKSSSEVIRELVDGYIERHDMRGYLAPIWDEISADFKKRNITQKDINEAIKEVRKQAREKKK